MDRTYVEALSEAPEPHRVLVGPVPCIRCSAWLEWAGAGWLNAGTRGRHDCAAFLPEQEGWPDPDYPGENIVPVPAGGKIVASWTRPTTGLPAVQQAHRAEPRWLRWLGAGILWLAAGLALAFLVALVARNMGAGW